jgi:hypothetical protein
VNGVSSKKKVGPAAKGAFFGSPTVAEPTHESGSPKLEGLAEAILSSSTGVRPSAAEEPFQSDVGVNTFSECERPSIPHKRRSSTRELSDATDLVLGPNLDLRTNRDHLVFCSSSHGARLAQVPESSFALLRSQHTANSCETRLGYDLASSLQLIGSPGGLLLGSQHPAGSCGPHTPHEPVQSRHLLATLGNSQSVDPTYPKYTAHDSRPASVPVTVCIHPDSSVPTYAAALPSVVPLPSMYWLLFDRDEHSIGGAVGDLRGASLSPLGELGGSGVAVASQASATPVSFLARWEDILTLERGARSSFAKNLLREKQAQFPEMTLIEQDDLGASLTNSGRCFCVSFSALQYRAHVSIRCNRVITPQTYPRHVRHG